MRSQITRPLILLLAASTLSAAARIADIEFFGYKGLDVDAVRKALPVKPGDPVTAQTAQQIRDAMKRVTGRDATDVAQVCCDKESDFWFYIGLAGESSRAFALNPEPKQNIQVPQELATLSRQMDDALFSAIRNNNSAEEQPSPGYRLPKDPQAREATLAFRQYALEHEDELYRVLESSSDGKQRAIAADALGFTNLSERQIGALIHASRDPDNNVRNNATRALVELAESGPAVAHQIPPDIFIEMLWSGAWTDRNKAGMLLWFLTASSDPQLLARLRAEAIEPLTEIAHWDTDHAGAASIILGRISALPPKISGIVPAPPASKP